MPQIDGRAVYHYFSGILLCSIVLGGCYTYIYTVYIYIERSVFGRARFEPPRFAPTSPCLRFPPLRPVPDSVMNGHEFYESSPGIVSYPLVN
jgi:hypothetical protein